MPKSSFDHFVSSSPKVGTDGNSPLLHSLPQDEALVDWRLPAAFLNLKRTAFWTLVRDDTIPHYRLNQRVIRFRMSAIKKWAEARKRGGYFLR